MSKEVYCDICGRIFNYPIEGQQPSGFGICNECYEEEE